MGSVRKALASSFAAFGVATLTSVVSVPLFLEAFGSSMYGFWVSLMSLTTYLALLNFGIAQAVSSTISTSPDVERAAVARVAIRTGLVEYAKIVGPIAPFLLLGAALAPWAEMFDVSSELERDTTYAAIAVGATFVVELVLSIFRSALYGLGEISIERMIFIGQGLARVSFAAAFSFLHPPLWLAIVALSGIAVAGQLLCFHVVRRKTRLPEDAQKEQPEPPRLRRSGFFFVLLSLGSTLIWSSDTIVIGMTAGADEAARVGVTSRVLMTMLALSGVLAETLAPGLAKRWADGDREGAADLSMRAAQLGVAAVSLALISLLAGGESLFHFWVGDEMFIGQIAWTAYILVIALQAVLIIPHYFVVQAAHHERYAVWSFFEGIIKIAIALPLISRLGIAALPIAALGLRMCSSAPVLIVVFSRELAIPLRRWVTYVAKPLFTGIPAFALVFGLLWLVLPHGHIPILIATVLAALAFAGTVFAIGIDPRSRATVTQLLRRRPA